MTVCARQVALCQLRPLIMSPSMLSILQVTPQAVYTLCVHMPTSMRAHARGHSRTLCMSACTWCADACVHMHACAPVAPAVVSKGGRG